MVIAMRKCDVVKLLKKFAGMMGSVLMLFSLLGCAGKGKTADKIEECLKQTLYEKYGIEAEVKEIEKITSQTPFGNYGYYATMYSEDETGVFHATIGEDGEGMTDDYPRVLYEDRIHQTVDAVLSSAVCLKEHSYKIVFCESTRTWKEPEEYEDYLKNAETYVAVRLEVDAESLEEVLEESYHIALELKEQQLQFRIDVLFEGQTIYLKNTKRRELPAYEELLEEYLKE